MFSAVLFDLDGTLLDLCGVHRLALRRALANYPEAPFARWSTAENAWWYSVGPGEPVFEANLEALPTKEKLRILRVPPHLVEPISQTKQQYTLDAIRTDDSLFDPQLKDFIQALGEKVPLGLVTNSVRGTAVAALQKAQIAGYFDLILSNEDAPAKPDPGGYRKACEILDLRPEQVLVLEDHPRGFRAAREAGCTLLPVRRETLLDAAPLILSLVTLSP